MAKIVFILRRFIDKGRTAKDPVWHQTLLDQLPITIGRDPKSIISLNLNFLSKEHGIISYKKGLIFDTFYYEDVSTNGTWYHPLWLGPGKEHEIDFKKTILIHRKKVKIEKGTSLIIVDNPQNGVANGVALTLVPNF